MDQTGWMETTFLIHKEITLSADNTICLATYKINRAAKEQENLDARYYLAYKSMMDAVMQAAAMHGIDLKTLNALADVSRAIDAVKHEHVKKGSKFVVVNNGPPTPPPRRA